MAVILRKQSSFKVVSKHLWNIPQATFPNRFSILTGIVSIHGWHNVEKNSTGEKIDIHQTSASFFSRADALDGMNRCAGFCGREMTWKQMSNEHREALDTGCLDRRYINYFNYLIYFQNAAL